jgi:enoyl-CoA hydratase
MTTEKTEVKDEWYGEDNFLLVRRDGPIAQVIFSKPERLNALPMHHTAGVDEAFTSLSADENIKVVIFRGEGRAFSTGGDMNWVGTQYTKPAVDENGQPVKKEKTPQRRMLNRDEWHSRGLRSVLNCTKIVIAEGKGYVLGVAMEYFMAADIVICSDDCIFGFPPGRMAGVAGNALLWMLRLGPSLSAEMTLMGRYIDAKEGLERNFINRVVPLAELEDTVNAAAEAICMIPADGLAIGKFARKMAYTTLGVDSAALESAMTHTLAVQLRIGEHDWNLMNERMEHGAKGAYKRRDARFQDSLSRYNPNGPVL